MTQETELLRMLRVEAECYRNYPTDCSPEQCQCILCEQVSDWDALEIVSHTEDCVILEVSDILFDDKQCDSEHIKNITKQFYEKISFHNIVIKKSTYDKCLQELYKGC